MPTRRGDSASPAAAWPSGWPPSARASRRRASSSPTTPAAPSSTSTTRSASSGGPPTARRSTPASGASPRCARRGPAPRRRACNTSALDHAGGSPRPTTPGSSWPPAPGRHRADDTSLANLWITPADACPSPPAIHRCPTRSALPPGGRPRSEHAPRRWRSPESSTSRNLPSHHLDRRRYGNRPYGRRGYTRARHHRNGDVDWKTLPDQPTGFSRDPTDRHIDRRGDTAPPSCRVASALTRGRRIGATTPG